MNDRIRPDLNRPPVQHVGEHRVRALSLSGLRDLLRDYGVDHRPILDEAGLSLDHGDELAWISLERFIKALTLAARVTGDRYFGLKHGTRGRFTANPLGYLMANSPDLRTGLRNYACFQPVLATNHLEFVETAGAGRIEFSYPVTIPNAVQMTDFVLMRFVSRIRTAVGSHWRPVSVGLMHRQPADISEYERHLGSRILFDQQVNSITISAATLALPLPHADPQLFHLVKRYCEEEIERQKSANHPLNGVREAGVGGEEERAGRCKRPAEVMRFVCDSAVGSHRRPVSVGLMHRQPADISEYERQLGSRIFFDQQVNSITISAATLALPMPHADPQLFHLVKRYCEEEIERQKSANHPLNGVREAMTRCLHQGSFGPKHVAEELGLTPGSLHRHLKAEGTSFLRVLDDTRRCLTHRYLMESSLKLTDIAARVGYSELSAFSRASRRWFGVSARAAEYKVVPA